MLRSAIVMLIDHRGDKSGHLYSKHSTKKWLGKKPPNSLHVSPPIQRYARERGVQACSSARHRAVTTRYATPWGRLLTVLMPVALLEYIPSTHNAHSSEGGSVRC